MHVNKKLKKETSENFWSFVLAVVLFIGTLVLTAVCCAVLMSCLGLRFTSYQGLARFLVSSAVVSCPISMVSEFIPKIICFDLKWIPKWQAVILYIVLTTVGLTAGFLFVSRYIKSVIVNKISAGAVSGLFALFSCKNVLIDRPQNT